MYREHQEVGSPADVVNKKGCLSGHHVLLLSLSGMKHTQLQKVEVGY